MQEIIFNSKWNSAKTLWLWGDGIIKEVKNEHHRETYDDMLYRKKYFFSLEEAKSWIHECASVRSPDGHANNSLAVSKYKIIKLQ